MKAHRIIREIIALLGSCILSIFLLVFIVKVIEYKHPNAGWVAVVPTAIMFYLFRQWIESVIIRLWDRN